MTRMTRARASCADGPRSHPRTRTIAALPVAAPTARNNAPSQCALMNNGRAVAPSSTPGYAARKKPNTLPIVPAIVRTSGNPRLVLVPPKSPDEGGPPTPPGRRSASQVSPAQINAQTLNAINPQAPTLIGE